MHMSLCIYMNTCVSLYTHPRVFIVCISRNRCICCEHIHFYNLCMYQMHIFTSIKLDIFMCNVYVHIWVMCMHVQEIYEHIYTYIEIHEPI